MKQRDNYAPGLFEWLVDHDISQENLAQMDPSLCELIDQYICLVDRMDTLSSEYAAENRRVTNSLLTAREQEIINILEEMPAPVASAVPMLLF